MAITPERRYTADEKIRLMNTIQQAYALCPERSRTAILSDLGLPKTTYYHWRARAAAGRLEDDVITPHRTALAPTPEEVWSVTTYAQAHPLLGYKRLTYALMAENQAFLRPWMVHDILDEAHLLGRRAARPDRLTRPPAADHPDQRWHTDLMLWWFSGRWFWLIDVLDAYSRYLIHYELLLTARADDVILAAQRAVDTLYDRVRWPGEPQIVHDGGPQFIGRDWATFVRANRLTDVRTHPQHPQSNGLDERAHRTFREEIPLHEEALLYQAQEVIATYRHYYNHKRPHSALHYLCPWEYYRGDPTTRFVEREEQLQAAGLARKAYWEAHRA